MLSILIPVYNINCSILVDDLLNQLPDELTYEIICIDDASTLSYTNTSKFINHPRVSHFKQEVNLGRSSIRNLLVEKSNYDWLLFLDADTLPVKSDFIQKYIDSTIIYPETKVFYGGINYRANDLNASNQLRYKFGLNRESISVEKRSKTPYLSLLMSNTFIHKSVFDKIQFNPLIKKYGHEDAVFSNDLCKKEVAVKHIENPIYHTGVEPNTVFLNKTKIAVENLLHLHQLGILDPQINKLLLFFFKIKPYKVTTILASVYAKFGTYLENKLNNKNPSLFLFDFYRLSYLCYLYHQKKQ